MDINHRHHVWSLCWARTCWTSCTSGACRPVDIQTLCASSNLSFMNFLWVTRGINFLCTNRFFVRYWSCWHRAKMKSSRTMSASVWWFYSINFASCSCRTFICWICSSAQRSSTASKLVAEIKRILLFFHCWFLTFTVTVRLVIKHVMRCFCACHCHRRTQTLELTLPTIRQWVQCSWRVCAGFTRHYQIPSRSRPSTGFVSQPTMLMTCPRWHSSWTPLNSVMLSYKLRIQWFEISCSTFSTRDFSCLFLARRSCK